MTSILDFSTQDARDKMIIGTEKKLIYSSPSGKAVYDLGTNFSCPRNPPYSYKSTVAVEDWDSDNLILSLNKKSDEKKKWYVQYNYKYDNGQSGPLHVSVNKILVAKYGLNLPISKVFDNVPTGYKPSNLFFDKALEAGMPLSANCTLAVEFNEDSDSYMRKLLGIFDDLKKATASFFLRGEGNELLDDQKIKKLSKAKTEEDAMDQLDFEEIVSKKKNAKDGTSQTVKYFDVLTYFDKPKNSSDVSKMSIKTHFYGCDAETKTTHDIHPSWCIKNEMHYSPVIYIQKGVFGQKYFKFKMLFNDVGVVQILHWSGVSKTPQQTQDSLLKLLALSTTPSSSPPLLPSVQEKEKESSPPRKTTTTTVAAETKKKETVTKGKKGAVAAAVTVDKKKKGKGGDSNSSESSSSSSSEEE